MAKPKQKKPKAVKPHQLKNVQVVDRDPLIELISPNDIVVAKSIPSIAKTYTPETLANAINQYFRNQENQPFNLASLQFALGFNDSEKWDNLLSVDTEGELMPLANMLRKATKYIESELVMLLLSRSQVAGIIFYLKAKFAYIEREIHEQITAQEIDIRFTVETEEEKKARQIRQEEEKRLMIT